jgi:hypothetical protein
MQSAGLHGRIARMSSVTRTIIVIADDDRVPLDFRYIRRNKPVWD